MPNTIQIKKYEGNIWKHFYDGTTRGYILSKFYVKQDDNFGKFQIIEEGGSQRISYNINAVTVYDIDGSPETFSTDVELFQRLRQLMYPGFDYSSEINPEYQLKTNISQDINADQSSILKYTSVKAVFDFFTAVYFWIKTGDDITNNNVGNVNVKLQSAKKFRVLNSVNSEVLSIDELANVVSIGSAAFTKYKTINGGGLESSDAIIHFNNDASVRWNVKGVMRYDSDYSGVFTDNDAVSKKYVDNAVSGSVTGLDIDQVLENGNTTTRDITVGSANISGLANVQGGLEVSGGDANIDGNTTISGNLTAGNFSGSSGGTNTGDETAQTIGNLVNGSTSKTTPVDADQLPLMDSASGNIIKKLSWLNLKSTLKTYFDSIYGTVFSVSSSDTATLTVATGTTTPVLTVVSSPKLKTARNINGTSFDGTADITVTAAPSGSAGGDLSGTYPNPQIAAGVIVNADINAAAAIDGTKINQGGATRGTVKLYTSLGNNTDGSLDQNTANTNFSLKADKSQFVKILDGNSSAAVTGTTALTLISTYTIPAGSFASSDQMKVDVTFEKTGTAGNMSMGIWINSVNNFGTATRIATFTPAAGNTYAKMTRTFSINGGNIRGYAFAPSAAMDAINAATTVGSTPLNPANVFYVFISTTNGSAADSVKQEIVSITN